MNGLMTVHAAQGRLFEVGGELGRAHEDMLGMLCEELAGLDLSGEEGTLDLITVMCVAAEHIAQTTARVSGIIDPESEELLQETIQGRLNEPGARYPFVYDPDVELKDIDVATDDTIERTATRAFELGRATVNRVYWARRVEEVLR